MTPEEYEQLVADVLAREGWTTRLTPFMHDYGIDVVAERAGTRLGVQAKMWRAANRPVNAATVMLTNGAAAYADCDRAMIATDARILDDALVVAQKLDVQFKHIAPTADGVNDAEGLANASGRTFSVARTGDPTRSLQSMLEAFCAGPPPAKLSGSTSTSSAGRSNGCCEAKRCCAMRSTRRRSAECHQE